MKRILLVVSLVVGCTAAAFVLIPSNIDPAHKFSWSENAGWMNWRDANGTNEGVVVGADFLSGYIWSENAGWINVGDGAGPYGNTTGLDFGVNVLGSGDLDGFAWGENIGWVNFGWAANTADPDRARFDWSANRFRGWVWAENEGWINLDDPTHFVAAPCVVPDVPLPPEPSSHADQQKNRYFSIVPNNPGRPTALRVTLTSSATFPGDVGKQWWVAAPVEICENSGQGPATPPANCGPAPSLPKKTLWSSSLTCFQACLDWNALTDVSGNPLDVLHISDADIVTDSTYTIEAIDCTCDPLDSGSYSAPLVLNTSPWGDLSGGLPSDCPRQGPDGSADLILDCVAILNKFSNLSCAMLKARVDIEPQIPDLKITITDVLRCVNAFSGFPYPFPGPVGCP